MFKVRRVGVSPAGYRAVSARVHCSMTNTGNQNGCHSKISFAISALSAVKSAHA